MARRDAAKDAGISPGKMNLIQKLWEATENDGVAATKDDFEEILTFAKNGLGESNKTYAESNVKDIMKAIKAARTDAKLDANLNDSEGEDVDEPGKGKANAPGQQLKAGTDDVDNQDSTLPNGKIKKNAPGKTGHEE
jgi:hypothetical protein